MQCMHGTVVRACELVFAVRLCDAHGGISPGGGFLPLAVQAQMADCGNPRVAKPRWQFAVDCVSFMDMMDIPIVNRVPAALVSAVPHYIMVHWFLLPPFCHGWQCMKSPSFILDPRCSFS